jgi:hypothetical protein
MNVKKLFRIALLVATGLVAAIGAVAIADPPQEAKSKAPEIKLPPGWTMADLQACIAAGTPGKNQEHLTSGAGAWHGKTTMWMSPGAEPMKSECISTVTPIMDGRYVKVEIAGEMPGMGPFSGFGIYGYDNVSQEFVATWIDNHNTGIMTGKGKLSADGKTLSWTYTHNCPLTKKPTVMRDIETVTGSNTKTLESFATDPKSGKEFKMMTIELTRK